MEIKGRILAVEPNFISNKAIVQIEVDNPNLGELEEKKGDLKITLATWRERRSLNANKFFHLLSDKLADARRMSKPEMKNYLLFSYGQKWRDENGQLICIKTNAPRKDVMNNADFHAWDIKAADDGTPMYVLLRHSSDFDTREMSILIDGVVQECKEQGIETMSPREIAELKERWGTDNG